MKRTMTVKGTGHISRRPDLIVISMTLQSRNMDHKTAMEQSAAQLQALQDALLRISFRMDDLKTVSYHVYTVQESEPDENGRYRSVFAGYVCEQALELEFDFDTERLSDTLSVIAGCVSDPSLSIHFTVKDAEDISRALLEDCVKNAREKAGILAAASGVKLGRLLKVDYNWTALDLCARTDMVIEERCMPIAKGTGMNMTPRDVEVSDTACFVWELL